MSALLPMLLPEKLPALLPMPPEAKPAPRAPPARPACPPVEGTYDRWWLEPSPVEWAGCPVYAQRVLLALLLRPVSSCKAFAAFTRLDYPTTRRALAWLRVHGLAGIVGHKVKALWALSDRGVAVTQRAVETLL